MKKLLFFAGILFSVQMVQSDGIYLWEYGGSGQQSCCLHIGNEDICNPNVACTRNISIDLHGIYDYIGRVLHMEKISTFPYAKFLNEAQVYIRKMAGGLSYRWDEYRLSVKFFHDMVLEQASTKNDKNKSSGTTTPATDVEKNKHKQEEVFEYLVKIGLASKFKK
jgi:hypothetical protein